MNIQYLKNNFESIVSRPGIKFALSVYRNYNARNGPLLAAGLAFFLLLALVPLFLVGVACLGYYLHATGSATDATQTIETWVTGHVLPGVSNGTANGVIESLDLPSKMAKISHYRSVSGIVGIVGLVSASVQIFLTGSVAMNAAWSVLETRNWITLRLTSLCLLIISGILVGLSIAATTAGTLLTKYVPSAALSVGTELAALIPAFFMYTLIFRILPSTKVTLRSAAFGALVASILWEVAKKGLAVYLVRPNPSMYGGLADLFAFLLWLYYSMMILLIGAEASAAYTGQYEKGAANLNVT